jgi:hypothetical protein
MEFLNGHSGCVQCGSWHIVVCSVDMEVNYYYVSIILRSVEGSFVEVGNKEIEMVVLFLSICKVMKIKR